MSTVVLELHPDDEYIELYKVLKIQGWVGGGGEAKIMISEGHVLVNQEVETRKRRKLVVGDNVIFGDQSLIIAANTRPASERVKPVKAAKPAKAKGRPSIKF